MHGTKILDVQGRCYLEPKVTLLIPVFNQSAIIKLNVYAALNSLTLPFDLILIDDASEDDTYQILYEIINSISDAFPSLCHAKLIRNRFSRFETYCDHIGIISSRTKYIVELQADMELSDFGFDRRVISAFDKYPDLMIVSGRGTQSFSVAIRDYKNTLGSDVAKYKSILAYFIIKFARKLNLVRRKYNKNISNSNDHTDIDYDNIFPTNERFSLVGEAGKLGSYVNSSLHLNERKLWFGGSVIRGPLVIDKAKYLEIGGFNTDSFFLGYDDHELCLKGWLNRKYRSAYHPICFHSPLENGSTRKKRSIIQTAFIFINLIRISRFRINTLLYKSDPDFLLGKIPYVVRNF